MHIYLRGGAEGRGGGRGGGEGWKEKEEISMFWVAGEQFKYLVAGEKLECLGDRGISPLKQSLSAQSGTYTVYENSCNLHHPNLAFSVYGNSKFELCMKASGIKHIHMSLIQWRN